jgi:hypothetical protein
MPEELQSALTHMKAALDLLDQADASGNVGAHLDLAICRLELLIQQVASDLEGIAAE